MWSAGHSRSPSTPSWSTWARRKLGPQGYLGLLGVVPTFEVIVTPRGTGGPTPSVSHREVARRGALFVHTASQQSIEQGRMCLGVLRLALHGLLGMVHRFYRP